MHTPGMNNSNSGNCSNSTFCCVTDTDDATYPMHTRGMNSSGNSTFCCVPDTVDATYPEPPPEPTLKRTDWMQSPEYWLSTPPPEPPLLGRMLSMNSEIWNSRGPPPPLPSLGRAVSTCLEPPPIAPRSDNHSSWTEPAIAPRSDPPPPPSGGLTRSETASSIPSGRTGTTCCNWRYRACSSCAGCTSRYHSDGTEDPEDTPTWAPPAHSTCCNWRYSACTSCAQCTSACHLSGEPLAPPEPPIFSRSVSSPDSYYPQSGPVDALGRSIAE